MEVGNAGHLGLSGSSHFIKVIFDQTKEREGKQKYLFWQRKRNVKSKDTGAKSC
jgi:hypothetical protein